VCYGNTTLPRRSWWIRRDQTTEFEELLSEKVVELIDRSDLRSIHRVRFGEVGHGTDAYTESVALRNEILRAPLGLQFTPAEIAQDRDSYHLAGWLDGAIVACVVLTPQSDAQVRMRQFAVRTERQRQGIGTALVRYAEAFSVGRGFTTITLHARATARQFYSRAGYSILGDTFTEVTIPHVPMAKNLPGGGAGSW